MKKVHAIIMIFLLVVSLTACGLTANSQEQSTQSTTATDAPTQEPTELPTVKQESVSTDHTPFTEGSIAYYKYAWGTSFEEVKNNEIKPGMVEGENYGYYDSGLSFFAKELVVDDEIKGTYFVTRLDFDSNDQLVSVMPVLEERLSNRDRAGMYLEFVAQCKELYGDPERITGLTVDENTDIDQFTQSVIDGTNCTCTWSDADHNQVIISCQMGQGRLDLIVIFNTKDYRM